MSEREAWVNWENPTTVCLGLSESWLGLKDQWPCGIMGSYNIPTGYIDDTQVYTALRKIMEKIQNR